MLDVGTNNTDLLNDELYVVGHILSYYKLGIQK